MRVCTTYPILEDRDPSLSRADQDQVLAKLGTKETHKQIFKWNISDEFDLGKKNKAKLGHGKIGEDGVR